MRVVTSILSLRTLRLGSWACWAVETIHTLDWFQWALWTVICLGTQIRLFLSCVGVAVTQIDSCVFRAKIASRACQLGWAPGRTIFRLSASNRHFLTLKTVWSSCAGVTIISGSSSCWESTNRTGCKSRKSTSADKSTEISRRTEISGVGGKRRVTSPSIAISLSGDVIVGRWSWLIITVNATIHRCDSSCRTECVHWTASGLLGFCFTVVAFWTDNSLVQSGRAEVARGTVLAIRRSCCSLCYSHFVSGTL